MEQRTITIYRGSGKNYTPIPQIIIQGQWLQKLGFSIGDKVTIDYQQDRLVIAKAADGSGESAQI